MFNGILVFQMKFWSKNPGPWLAAKRERQNLKSLITGKNPEGKILKVKFSKTQASQNIKPDNNGLITVYEKSPLALAILGRTVGETCQLGMLELYYEILCVE